MATLSLSEKEVLRQITTDREQSACLQAWLQLQEQKYTRMCRDQQNVVPEDLHAEVKKKTLAAQYGAIAKAYGTMWSELVKGVESVSE